MTFIADIKISTLHLCLIHDHTPAITAHQNHIIQQLFSHPITLLQLPRRLFTSSHSPLTCTHMESAGGGSLSRVAITFWHNGLYLDQAPLFPTMLSRACWDSERLKASNPQWRWNHWKHDESVTRCLSFPVARTQGTTSEGTESEHANTTCLVFHGDYSSIVVIAFEWNESDKWSNVL